MKSVNLRNSVNLHKKGLIVLPDIQLMIKRIDDTAQKYGLSRNQFLIKCDSKYYVDNLLKGTVPKIDTIERIADYYNVSIDYLVGRTDNPEVNR
jgi:transcriptional regulator with XRE-family HTH domain